MSVKKVVSAALGILLLFVAIGIAARHLTLKSDAYRVAEAFARTDSRIEGRLGKIEAVSLAYSGGYVKFTGGSGKSELNLKVRGQTRTEVIHLVLLREKRVWHVERFSFE